MNLTGPYEKTAHEIMHEEDDAATKTTGRKTGAG
jgi:hypothetical protein